MSFLNNTNSQGRDPSLTNAPNCLVGMVVSSSGDEKISMVSTHTLQSALFALPVSSGSFPRSALMSMEGMFRPFSVSAKASGIPHFEEPKAGASKPTVNDLNPFASGTDIAFVTSGDTVTKNKKLSTSDSGSYDPKLARGIALRGPLIISGWGYDMSGKPVPNKTPDSPTDEFLPNYQNHCDKWKTGPLDARWDDDRKVWVAGNSSVNLAVVVQHSGSVGGRPLYIVRLATGYSSGVVQYDSTSSGVDLSVFNLQESVNDKHTIGVKSPVILHKFYGEYVMNEHVRTLIRRM